MLIRAPSRSTIARIDSNRQTDPCGLHTQWRQRTTTHNNVNYHSPRPCCLAARFLAGWFFSVLCLIGYQEDEDIIVQGTAVLCRWTSGGGGGWCGNRLRICAWFRPCPQLGCLANDLLNYFSTGTHMMLLYYVYTCTADRFTKVFGKGMVEQQLQ